MSADQQKTTAHALSAASAAKATTRVLRRMRGAAPSALELPEASLSPSSP